MDRKGGALVEATLVFPVVLLSLMASVGTLMFLYEDAASQADLHQAIRYQAGRETDTYIGQPGSSQVLSKIGVEGIYRVLHGETTLEFEGTFLSPRSFLKTQQGRMFLTDERKHARIIDFFTVEEKRDADDPQNKSR
jgi:hypothetical protein